MAALHQSSLGIIWAFLFITVVSCQLTCNFEYDTCKWHVSNGWMRSQGNASNLDTGPTYDHSTNPDGFYLHLNAKHLQPNEKTFIFSPSVFKTNKKYCLSFYYLMHGKQVATLSVHVSNSSSTSNEVWATSFEHGPEWLHQEVLIENGRQVIFEGVFGGELGDIAIDDIKLRGGECLIKGNEAAPSPAISLPFKCTFEGRTSCGFQNHIFNMEDWEIGSGSTSVHGTGPDNDHTLRTPKGHYYHVDASDDFFNGQISLTSPYFITKKEACVQFWYNMYGPGSYEMAVDINYREEWSKKGSQGYGWKSAFLPVKGVHRFDLAFHVTTRAHVGDIAIDDISIQEGECPQSVDCSFENPLCPWSNTGDEDFDWSPRTGKHTGQSLGPKTDHTLKSANGTYMIIESTKPRRHGDRARLVSTTITENVKTNCLQFWYSMGGKDVGELRVFIYNQTKSSLVWKLVGPQGEDWKFASVPIYPRRENFWLVIEGVVGLPSKSYIAFDDISLTEGNCKVSPIIAGGKVTPNIPVQLTTPSITVNPSNIILSCDFTNDFCGWQQGKKDKGDWKRTHLAGSSDFTGPKRDHTTGNGSYIFVDSKDGAVGFVRLFSPLLTPTHKDMCLKFWYFMYGMFVKSLRVFISPGRHFHPDMNPHWKRSGSQSQKWTEGNILIQMTQTFQIVFEAKMNVALWADIALDDILLAYGPCNAGEEITTPKPGITEKPIPIEQRNCDFESKNICGYEHVKGSPRFYWIRNSGETSSLKTGPSTDHTTNTAEGFYMYIEGSHHAEGTVARMVTPLYQDSTSVCLQFYYHMYGSGIGDFRIYILPRGNISALELIYNTTGNHGLDWAVDRVTIDKLTAVAGYKIMFEATVGKNFRADIALDDISFSAGKCAYLGDCNFEDDSCTWKNVAGDDFDWLLKSGKTDTPQTGPDFDHTLGNVKGHYMYIETSYRAKAGMKARWVSALLPRTDGPMCLTFWYNMNGKTVDSLNVFTQVSGSPSLFLWHLKGNQGKKWHFARAPLFMTASTYTISFEATTGHGYMGDIAIDDISFTENKCAILPVNARVTTTAAPHVTTTPTTQAPERGNFSCNFDKDFCGWKPDLQDKKKWIWQSGRTPSKDTGPPGDHTTGKGHYIFLETSQSQAESKAHLTSPNYIPDNTGISCVSFWYYMYGADVDSLNVYIQYGLTRPSLPIWSAKGDQGQKWIYGKFFVNSTQIFNVVLEAIVGVSFKGDIAVDDVSISTGKCVENNKDVSTECDFESKGLCGFTQSMNDNYDWIWRSGMTPSNGTGPTFDHTLQTREGHYIYVEGTSKPYGSSILKSSRIQALSTNSCIQFYYHMKGSVGELFLYQKVGSHNEKTIWYRGGHQSNTWQLASIEQPAQTSSYTISFDGKVGGSRFGDIAVDDFSVRKGKCPVEGLCDFEIGTCIWKNLRDDDFDWIIKKGDESSNSTGPAKDHTINRLGLGHYLYVSADDGVLHTNAVMETKDLEPHSKTCLHFWFNGHGKDPGTLTVSYKTRGNSRAIWQLVGTNAKQWPKNGKWIEARVHIPRTSRIFTINIEVVLGSSGYIAVDDILLDTENDCSRMPTHAVPVITTTIPTTQSQNTRPKTSRKQVVSGVTCTFSGDFCGWTQDKKDDLDWIRRKGPTPTYMTGPRADHTSKRGYYIYIESSKPTKLGDVARIISPKFTLENNQKRCLTFWYNMYGKTIGTLSLLLLVKGKLGAPIWKRQKSQGRNWIKGQVNLQGFPSLQVVFEANSGSGSYGDIALDDIYLHKGSCHSIESSPLPSCDFEGTCNYNSFTPIKWIITSQSKHPSIADHTYNTRSGEFMYANITGASTRNDAQIETPLLDAGQYCLEFFYRPIHKYNGYLGVRALSHGFGGNLFFKYGPQMHNQWTIAEMNLKYSSSFKVTFGAYPLNGAQGTIAVDDVVFKKGVCPSAGSCDFERGHLCFWTNDPTNKVNWEVHAGKSPTYNTGPETDHTKGNVTSEGTYALLETSYPAKPGDKARLISQSLNNKNIKSCFQFWYSMNGRQVASLSIFVKSGYKVETRYWSLSGNQGDDWNYGQVPLPAVKGDFQIVIEGSVGGRYGDIALDDLIVVENGCGLSPRKARVNIATTAPPIFITTTNTPIISGNKTFNCTFEKGTCGWVQSNTDQLNWTRNKGYTPTRETGPQGDHTTGRGYYMYLEATGQRNTSNAQLMFVATDQSAGFKCMQFWYSMRGTNVGSLNIYIITKINQGLPIWTKSGTQGPTWNLGKIEFKSSATFKVVIEGVKSRGILGDIALDDVTLQNGGCKEPYGDCDFEDISLCGYKNDPTGDFNWTRGHGNTRTWRTGPSVDHTFGSYRGHYMYIESSSRKPNDTARLISPIYKAIPDEHCLQFYYTMFGAQVGALNVKIRIHNPDKTIRDTDNHLHIVGNQGIEWKVAQVELPKIIIENPYQLMFEGVIDQGERGDIAIDDIVINSHQCEIGGDCDFDHGRCTWRNAYQDDDFDWMIGSGSTLSLETGPLTDHTLQNANGFYLFIDASFPRSEGQNAWYVSQDFTPTFGETRCITFWYSMNGLGVGTLRVLIQFATGGNNTLWELSKDQGNDWKFGQAPIKSPTSYKIIFEAVRGPDHRGDIAIDDILFTEFACSVSPFDATPRGGVQTLPTIKGTTPTSHARKGLNCTFDLGVCGWTQDTDDKFDWSEIQGETPESGTGPSGDHSKDGRGYYFYIDAKDHRQDDVARLSSPLIRPNGLQCFTVWYHMYGSDVGSFDVYIFTGPKLPGPIFHRYGTQQNKWQKAEIQFNCKSPYNIKLSATVGSGPKGNIAVDAVSLVDGHCVAELVGDKRLCNFEDKDICNYTQDPANEAYWKRSSHTRFSDHTYGTTSGHFMSFSDYVFKSSGVAVLSTPIYNVNSTDLCMEFWYHMSGVNIGQLQVYYLTNKDNFKSQTLLWSREGHQQNRWLQGLIDIDLKKDEINHVQIKFHATVGKAYWFDIALDDVQISTDVCKRKRGECNFEKDKCNWVNVEDDDFDWTIGSGHTTTTKSGPLTDHTQAVQGGSYLYIEPESTLVYKDGSKSKQSCVLASVKFDQSQLECFQFYYYMSDAKDGALEVLVLPEGKKTMTSLWKLEGHQGKNWTKAQIHVPSSAKTYQVILKGYRGPRFEGQIAIDDLNFSKLFPCETVPQKAEISLATSTTPLPTTPAPIVGFDCTFDKDYCSWRVGSTSAFRWTRRKSTKSGPSSDHTGDGFFVYVESSMMTANSRQTVLSSISFDLTTPRCLSFYYYMSGEDSNNTLSVNLNHWLGIRELWKRIGPQEGQWIHATINLPGFIMSESTSIDFNGTKSINSAGGFMALDDITLYPEECQEAQNKSVIDCNFEIPRQCGYTQNQDDNFDWSYSSRFNGKLQRNSPKKDHTYGTDFGHYMYIDYTKRSVGVRAVLSTPELQEKQGSCLTFWYHMSVPGIGSLEVHFNKIKGLRPTDSSPVWARRGAQGNHWNQEYIPIEHSDSFQVSFHAVSGRTPGGIAIDDVKLLPSCLEPGDCTFEINTCGWHNAEDNKQDWQYKKLGHIGSKEPSADHTTNSAFGHIMIFSTHRFFGPGRTADLISVSLDPTSEKGLCLEFWFMMNGYGFGNLTVFKQSNSTEKTMMWQLSQTSDSSWYLGKFMVKSSEPYQIIFRASGGKGVPGFIAIDDINYSTGICGVVPIQAKPDSPPTAAPSMTTTMAPHSTIPPSPYDCTFENGFCGWTQGKDNDFNWRIGMGSTPSGDTGPLKDHTLGTRSGHFTFIETSFPRKPNDTARLVSPIISEVGVMCLTFWYHMYGEHINTLNVYVIYNKYVRRSQLKSPSWSRSGTLNRKWYAGKMRLFSLSDSYVIFEATRGESGRGDIALDDIRITKGHCPETVTTCDFENGDICNYKQSGKDDYDWSVGNGSVSLKLPRKDHTSRTSAGHFMYVLGKQTKSKAQIIGPIMGHTFGSCVRFWYSLNGTIKLNVYSVSDGQKSMLDSYMSSNQTNWISANINIKSRSTWEVMFESTVVTQSPNNYIAIDDIQLTKGICGMAGDCTFETDKCGWSNTKYNDNFDWIIKRAMSGGSGPMIDHSLQNSQGSYIYIDGSSPQKQGDTAILRHIYLNVKKRRCFRFWYSMHRGTLEISLVDRTILWRIHGEHGPDVLHKWKYAQVPLSDTKSISFIYIKGIIGSGAVSYIAIDDFSFISSSCTRSPVDSDPSKQRPPTTPITPVTVTPSLVLNSTYDCSFEHGFCSWTQSNTDNFNWTRWHGRTLSSWTGPDADHTTGKDGWYIFIESSRPQHKGDRAVLVSPPFKNDTQYCFMFYYHMYGTTLGKLNVILTNEDGSNMTLWTKSSPHGKLWMKEAFRVSKQKREFTLSFEGIIRGNLGDIAIDDVRVTEGECAETGPLNCTFESAHLCGYTTPANHDIKWKQRINNKNGRLGPANDHTLGTHDGTYMYLEWNKKDVKNGQAQLISPPIKTSSDFCMSFYYQSHLKTQGDMRIYQQVGNAVDTLIWIRYMDRYQTWTWTKGQVTLPARQNYKVVFEGNLRNYNGSIQIDDISTIPGSCPEPGNCNFEKGMCTWKNMNKLRWTIGKGDTASAHTGPTTDHTTFTDKGYYMFIESSYVKQGSKARLRSQAFPPTSARCMHVWYHMYGKQTGGIKIYFADEKSGNETAIWHLSGEQGNKWQYAQVAFAWTDVNYVIIEGIVGGYLSDVAIDDVTFTQDYCATMPSNAQTDYVFPKAVATTPGPTWSPTTLDCNFENNCSWTQSKDNDIYFWIISKPPPIATAIRHDHTLGTREGHYISIQFIPRQKGNNKPRFESPPFIPTEKGCLQFWYFIFGLNVDALTVYLKEKDKLTPMWKKTWSLDDAWHQGLVPVRSNKTIQIVFEGKLGNGWAGDMAIDDIAFSYKGCPSSADMTCGFETSDICGFRQSKERDFEWEWFSPEMKHTMRQNDHTLGTLWGHYMLASGSKHKLGEKAVIISPTYTSKTSKCVEFWYYMTGEKSGSLNVYTTANSTRMMLWSRSGNHGEVWSFAQMTVMISGSFNLEIEAVNGEKTGNIAIDDFGMFHGDCPRFGDCDFEKGWCTWRNNRTDDFDWQIGTGHLGMFGGPRRDHTTDSVAGHFIFLQAGFPFEAGARAVLVSETFEGSFYKCMSFWYFMKDAATATVNIYVVTSESKTLAWTMSGDQVQTSWRYGRFPIKHKQGFKIIIEGIKGAGDHINIAIDDLSAGADNWLCPYTATSVRPTVTPTTTTHIIPTTPVPTEFDCTFEKGMCQWKQDTGDAFDWIRSQGPMGSKFFGPLKDHTLGTDNGWYVFADSTPTAKLSDEARLIGPQIVASKDRCFNFWYHMYGAYVDTLTVYLRTNGTNQTIWSRRGDQGDSWVEAFLNLPAQTNTTYQVIFGSGRAKHFHQQIALDDIRFTEEKCHENNPNFCDFEDADLCKYTQLTTDDFDWTWWSGRTPTFFTGPVFDHTTDSKYGHYMYINSTGQKPFKKAQFRSPKYNSSETKCLHFYYYMYGDHVNALNVYKVDGDNSNEVGTPIWSHKYKMGPIWVEGQASIFPGNNYHIIFEGITGKSSLSDIAIDDISLTSGPCQRPGFCDFEIDLCTWKNIDTDQFDWIRARGATESQDTGPYLDHTLGTPQGYYIYIETSSPQTPGDVARLQSEDFHPHGMSLCLQFWYQMHGEDVDSLNVIVKNVNEVEEAYVWKQKGNNGPHWLYGQLNVDKRYTNKPYHLIFEGIRGKGPNGDIAIDDVTVSMGECAVYPTYADPKQMALSSTECSFDDGNFCELKQKQNDEFDWQITKERSHIFHSGPETDHSGSGYYIYTKSVMTMGQRAILSTPTLGPTTGEGNCFTFYYHMYGMNIGHLNIYTVINGNESLRWTKSGEQGNSWKHGHFNINSKFNYQIYIESVTSGGYRNVIGLDDLAMDGNPCPPARECDFSLGMCGWTSAENYKPWEHAVTPTPIADHDTGTIFGGFLYTNATSSKTATVVSRVLSPSYSSASVSCLKFWYYMDGKNPGELHVAVKLPFATQRIWQRKEAQGDLWWFAHVDVGEPKIHLTQAYQFVFDSVQSTGPNTNGLIAIDDVEHLPGPCTNKGVCDFEQEGDLCGFNNLKGDDLDWIRESGATSYVPPREDHTLRSRKGHYMYIRGGSSSGIKTGRLASWTQEKTDGKCLKFWYTMIGSGIGKLNILMWTSKGSKTLWTKSENNRRLWVGASITLISKDPFSVVFEGVKMNYPTGIAIDDIVFLGGSCETQTTPSAGLTTPLPTPDSIFRCDFEQSLCGWKQDTTDKTDWIKTTGKSNSGGPPMDHTKDNDKGGYITVKSSTIEANRTARLMSDVMYQDKPICLTFWYHMHGESPGTLNVYVKNMGERDSPVWTKSGAQGSAWRYAEIEIAKPEKTNKISFEATRGLGSGDISLDDVDLLLDNCPARDSCDFEEPEICGYEQGDADIFDWFWRSGRTPTYRTGPQNDHTYGTKYGHYMYIEVSNQSLTSDDNAKLYSPVYPATTEERCLTFWYSMNGKNIGKLNVYLYQNNKIGDQIWSLQMNQGPHWHLATVPVKSETPYQVLFEGVRGGGYFGDIAIDDVKLSKEACDPVAFCTFEEGICGWENLHDIGGADFDWQRTEASSIQSKVGPQVDHTIEEKSGFYMLLDDDPRKVGAARLKSQTVVLLPHNPKSYCFHFWYSMYRADIGHLNVNITYHGDRPQRIWSNIPGNNTKGEWQHGMVLIEGPYSHFEIVLEAIVDSAKDKYIALDDLQLLPGICPDMEPSKFTCKSGKKISSSKVCDFIKDCPDSDDEANCGDCTFEDDMCTWGDHSPGEFRWSRNQGPVNGSTIKTDHGNGNGTEKGWYVSSNSVYKTGYNSMAFLQNRALQQTSASCELNFWYFDSNYRYADMSLNVMEGGKITTLFTIPAGQYGEWKLATVYIGKISRPFMLLFSRKGKYDGIFAIDDIYLKDCSFPAPQESCASTEFQCKSKGCVDKSRICDISDDCGDKSDEINCQNFSSCDFESSLCFWSQDNTDDFDWRRRSEFDGRFKLGPTRDHSKGTASGYYMYASGTRPYRRNAKTRLISPLIEPPGNNQCWIRFFYHLGEARTGGFLNVYTRTSLLGSYEKVWSKDVQNDQNGDSWERADVKLFSDTYFQVLFEAVIIGHISNIALDDITLTPGCRFADSKVKLPNGTKTEPTKSPCRSGLFHCKSSECILQSQVCDFKKHCKDGSDEQICGTCDFEHRGICEWKERSSGRYKWMRQQGKSPGLKDHTTNSETGKYMMVHGAYGIFHSPASLETRPLGATQTACQVEFYVYMLGKGAGTMSLNIIDPITHKIRQQVVEVSGSEGAKWKKVVGNIGAQPAGFALQISASPTFIDNIYKTDMALDDVKLLNCAPETGSATSKRPPATSTIHGTTSTKKVQPAVTSTPKSPDTCGEDSFTCPAATNLCFPLAYRCDGHADCPDSSDEEDCVTCPKGQTYCIPKKQCILSHRCDRIKDCPDGSDESACEECRDDLCLNGANCTMESGSPKCQCKENDITFRCQAAIRSAPQKSSKVWTIPVGIIMALIILAVLAGVSYMFWKRKNRQYSPENLNEREGITNPAYDYGANLPAELNLSEDANPISFEPTWNLGNGGFKNPFYSAMQNDE